MKMSAQEVKEFWQDFCKRHKVPPPVVERGNARIDEDPEYWSDHTMWELLEEVRD
jgi:hypothetical protein